MPKLKTNRSLAKRVKITKRGKVLHYRAGKSHILTKKRSKRKRHLRRPGLISQADIRNIKRLLPYGT